MIIYIYKPIIISISYASYAHLKIIEIHKLLCECSKNKNKESLNKQFIKDPNFLEPFDSFWMERAADNRERL